MCSMSRALAAMWPERCEREAASWTNTVHCGAGHTQLEVRLQLSVEWVKWCCMWGVEGCYVWWRPTAAVWSSTRHVRQHWDVVGRCTAPTGYIVLHSLSR